PNQVRRAEVSGRPLRKLTLLKYFVSGEVLVLVLALSPINLVGGRINYRGLIIVILSRSPPQAVKACWFLQVHHDEINFVGRDCQNRSSSLVATRGDNDFMAQLSKNLGCNGRSINEENPCHICPFVCPPLG